MLPFSVETFKIRPEVSNIGYSSSILGPGAIFGELRDGDGRQDADDGHNDHQLNKGKTFLAPLFHLIQERNHTNPPFALGLCLMGKDHVFL